MNISVRIRRMITVRMIFHGLPAVCLPDLIIGSTLPYSKDSIVIPEIIFINGVTK